MPDRPDALRLLTGLLPLGSLGPALRRGARQAVASRDPERIRRVALSIAGELIRRGDLVRVAIEGAPAAGSFFLPRGGTQLIDLSALLPPGRGPGPPRPPRPDAAPPALARDTLERLLQAMEQAQSLPLGEPQGNRPQVVLEGICEILGAALPGVRLGVLLFEEAEEPLPSPRWVAAGTRGQLPAWVPCRPAGGAVWLDSVTELPDALRPALLGSGRDGPAAEAAFAGAVGVPLLEPLLPQAPSTPGAAEIGLLLLAPVRPLTRARLFAQAQALSRFVTERWRQHLEMSQLVHSDSLTGVHNRAYFDLQLGLELERARRHESPLALVLADIDRFKRINDAWGHPAGDVVLRTVARELQAGLRRIDMVCRIGGEEFALILPDTQPAAAQEVGLRLLERMDRLRLSPPGVPEPLRVTLSFGAVTFPEGGTDPVELYRKADGMLYVSKRRGRNRCTFWNPAGDPLVLVSPLSSAS